MYKIKEENNVIKIIDGEKTINFFKIYENFEKTLELLKQFNKLKTTEDIPIYRAYTYHDLSLWSSYQLQLFLHLKNYIKYEDLIRYLHKNRIKEVELDNNPTLKHFLEINEINVLNKQKEIFPKKLGIIISMLIAKAVSVLAMIKINQFRNAEILVYTPDKFSSKNKCDFRFSNVYEYLNSNGLKYVEIFHSTYTKEFLLNLLKRRRLALYLESLNPSYRTNVNLSYSWDLGKIDAGYRNFFKSILSGFDKHYKISVDRIEKLSKILKKSKINVLIAIDDPRYINEIIIACKKCGIKSYGFQHGHFTKYHAGWHNYEIPKELSISFDTLFLWNEYWKKVLISYSTQYDENNVKISGPLRQLKLINYKNRTKPKTRVSDMAILVPYESLAPKEEVMEYIKFFIESKVKIFFKIRPDIAYELQLYQYGINDIGTINIVEDLDEDVLSSIDAVVGTYSTFLNEMLYYKKPVIILKTSLDLGHQLVDDNLAYLIEKENLDLVSSHLLDYINNYKDKKSIAWPHTNEKLEYTLDKIFKEI